MRKDTESVRVEKIAHGIDVLEDSIRTIDGELLNIMLMDRTTRKNILWATTDYEVYGDGYKEFSEIMPDAISGVHTTLIQPRITKTQNARADRTRNKAEVFTPSWICNKQNNLVDTQWFGMPDVVNVEKGTTWKTTVGHISFEGARGGWKKYVDAQRLEISCGEAPYLVSRYDTVTGERIPRANRIGLLDRKMRIVQENATSAAEWLTWSQRAFESVYGYEYQGDNLLLARENLLCSYIEYYYARFSQVPEIDLLRKIARIISWNIWQMDGLKGVIPGSCKPEEYHQMDLFDTDYSDDDIPMCPGCAKGNIHRHTGIYCRIMDWRSKCSSLYISMLRGGKGVVSYEDAFKYKLIYIMAIDDDNHKGYLKIGEASLASTLGPAQLSPNCDALNGAAHNRIKEYTKTALIPYQLLHTEIAVRFSEMADGTMMPVTFKDTDIHDVLARSGYLCKRFPDTDRDSEWYAVDLDTAISAVRAYKEYRYVLSAAEKKSKAATEAQEIVRKIVLRQEQEDAVEKTLHAFKSNDAMLWDCKMRFGKTLTSYELIRRAGFQKTIVVTHRPVVEEGWQKDHDLIFGKDSRHLFVTKRTNNSNYEYDAAVDFENERTLHNYVQQGTCFVYFASMQDLRGSVRAGGKFHKNNAVFEMDWDFIIYDEAHEGTQTDLGQNVQKLLDTVDMSYACISAQRRMQRI